MDENFQSVLLEKKDPTYEILKMLGINFVLSVVSGIVSYYLMKQYIPIFIQRKLYGFDQCKTEKSPVPEPMGIISASVYLIFMFLFIPVLFVQWIHDEDNFPYVRLLSLLSAIISICTAILLGFADDILDLRWRHKLLFPTLSSLPLLMIYYISGSSTSMLLPGFVRDILGINYYDFGILFYIYMGMLVIFATNAINIIAGINGVEVSQGIVISASIAVFNIIQIFRLEHSLTWYQGLSLCIIGPFLATSIALYMLNRYPAKVFVGDTYCYWAGMTLAVVGILGRFSKTLFLFLLPQVINFIYSVPQLFHLVPCPRHRLPKFDAKTNTLSMSLVQFKATEIKQLGQIIIWVASKFGLLYKREFEKDGERWIEVNNMTILNLILKFFGPLPEHQLTVYFVIIQIFCSIVAFIIRFYVARLLYEVVN